MGWISREIGRFDREQLEREKFRKQSLPWRTKNSGQVRQLWANSLELRNEVHTHQVPRLPRPQETQLTCTKRRTCQDLPSKTTAATLEHDNFLQKKPIDVAEAFKSNIKPAGRCCKHLPIVFWGGWRQFWKAKVMTRLWQRKVLSEISLGKRKVIVQTQSS